MSTAIAALSGPQINHAEFVQLVGPTFNNTWCNAASDITVNGVVYAGLGGYLGIDQIQQDLKGTSVDLKLMITGLDPSSISLILSQNIKGSLLTISRGFLDSNNQILYVGGVQQFFGRYQGIVNNISITEQFDNDKRVRVATCGISSASMRYVLDSRVAGIKTNPASWRSIYPNDTSMDRVPVIASTYFNFGKQPTGGSASKVLGSTQQNPVALVKFNN
jgi:hypothetical protein